MSPSRYVQGIYSDFYMIADRTLNLFYKFTLRSVKPSQATLLGTLGPACPELLGLGPGKGSPWTSLSAACPALLLAQAQSLLVARVC